MTSHHRHSPEARSGGVRAHLLRAVWAAAERLASAFRPNPNAVLDDWSEYMLRDIGLSRRGPHAPVMIRVSDNTVRRRSRGRHLEI